MADSESTIELLRDVREILRDSARSSAAQAELTAVAYDRLGRTLDDNEKMRDILTRIDTSLKEAEAAKALAKANADLRDADDKASTAKVLERISAAASSSMGQRILMLVGYLVLGWLGLRYGVVSPGPATMPNPGTPEAVPTAIVAPSRGSDGSRE